MADKPLLYISTAVALRIDGQWYARQTMTLDADTATPECGASGGSVRISGILMPCSAATAREVLDGRPALDISGPVYVEDALRNSGGAISASGGWLGTVRQHATLRERRSKVTETRSETGAVTRTVEPWADTGSEMSFWFHALGIVRYGTSGLEISGARPQDVAQSKRECADEGLLTDYQEEILEGTHVGFFGIQHPRWDMAASIAHSVGEGPFASPRHRAMEAINMPLQGGGGSGSSEGDVRTSVIGVEYWVSASFNYFTMTANSRINFTPHFDN